MKPTFITLMMCLCLHSLAYANQAAGKDAAEKAYDEGRYTDALRLFAAELAKEEAKPKPDWKRLSYYNSYLGLAHRSAGEYDKALEYFQKGRDARLRQFGPGQIDPATTYLGMAIAYGAKKNYIKEKEFLRKARSIQAGLGFASSLANSAANSRAASTYRPSS